MISACINCRFPCTCEQYREDTSSYAVAIACSSFGRSDLSMLAGWPTRTCRIIISSETCRPWMRSSSRHCLLLLLKLYREYRRVRPFAFESFPRRISVAEIPVVSSSPDTFPPVNMEVVAAFVQQEKRKRNSIMDLRQQILPGIVTTITIILC
jgi:hypothetical protein